MHPCVFPHTHASACVSEHINKILSNKYCFKKNGYYIKDLRILKDRDQSKIVFLDTSIISLCNQMDNAIIIPPYFYEKNDTSIYKVINMLKSIAWNDDIRKEIRKKGSISDIYKVYKKKCSNNAS